jgi:hypothetical protein
MGFWDYMGARARRPLTNQEKVYGRRSGCFIATAVYGSYDCPQVWTLRRYRDFTLAESWFGRMFIHVYYVISPTLVKWFGQNMWFKKFWRAILDRKIKNLHKNGIKDSPYNDYAMEKR